MKSIKLLFFHRVGIAIVTVLAKRTISPACAITPCPKKEFNNSISYSSKLKKIHY
jgi:hypothetical protein